MCFVKMDRIPAEMLAWLAALRAKVMGWTNRPPRVALGFGQPRAQFLDTFGVVIMARCARTVSNLVRERDGGSEHLQGRN